jgi:hypothetical protein
MSVENLHRYEMGRCVSCGDCNREPAYVDEQGDWVRFEDVVEVEQRADNSAMVPFCPWCKSQLFMHADTSGCCTNVDCSFEWRAQQAKGATHERRIERIERDDWEFVDVYGE